MSSHTARWFVISSIVLAWWQSLPQKLHMHICSGSVCNYIILFIFCSEPGSIFAMVWTLVWTKWFIIHTVKWCLKLSSIDVNKSTGLCALQINFPLQMGIISGCLLSVQYVFHGFTTTLLVAILNVTFWKHTIIFEKMASLWWIS